jgi:hypothetical protein
MTQCILSHILTDHHHQLNRDRLASFYNDCLDQDELLDDLATNNIDRRQINRDYSTFFLVWFYILLLVLFLLEVRYHDPYVPLSRYENLYPASSSGIPLFIQFNGQSRLPSLIEDESNGNFYIDDENIFLYPKSSKSMAEESIMSNRF